MSLEKAQDQIKVLAAGGCAVFQRSFVMGWLMAGGMSPDEAADVAEDVPEVPDAPEATVMKIMTAMVEETTDKLASYRLTLRSMGAALGYALINADTAALATLADYAAWEVGKDEDGAAVIRIAQLLYTMRLNAISVGLQLRDARDPEGEPCGCSRCTLVANLDGIDPETLEAARQQLKHEG